MKIVNRKARFDYILEEKIECGIKLTGAEVKAVRSGAVSLSDSYVKFIGQEAYLLNAFIGPYQFANNENYDPKRSRKLLLHKKEILALVTKMKQSNLTMIPTAMYTIRQLVKVEAALAKGKKKWDKREALKERSIKREQEEEQRGKKN
jgi:SsrA-binding protein